MSGSWRERDDPENRACEISLARLIPQSTAASASAAGIDAAFILVGSLDFGLSIYRTRRSSSLLALGWGWGGGCFCVGSINLT